MSPRMPDRITDGPQYDDHDIGCPCDDCQEFDDSYSESLRKEQANKEEEEEDAEAEAAAVASLRKRWHTKFCWWLP